MGNGFGAIKKLGSQKIHETTHISRRNIDIILDREFDALPKIQFLGFISIIEREYTVDLSALKAEYDAYHKAKIPIEEPITPPVKRAPKEKREIPKIVIAAAALALVVIIAVVALVSGGGEEKSSVPVAVEETAPITDFVEQPEETEEDNTSLPEAQSVVEAVPFGPLVIIPKSKLWMGFIDLETHEKKQKLTTKTIELDAQKSSLMVFGHGFLMIENGEEMLDFKGKRKLRFLYEEGVVTKIDKAEFLERNRGESW